MNEAAPYRQVIEDYEALEPGEGDSWNPLNTDFELLYRLRLMYSAKRAMKAAKIKAESIRVLDLGCGNGRSTRMYLDLGLLPGQLRGVDLRPGAVAAATLRNPAIEYLVYDGVRIPPATGGDGYDWVQLSTVVSSVKDPDTRRLIVKQIEKTLKPDGYVFYFDLVAANRFAGGDAISPEQNLFGRYRVVWRKRFYSWSLLPFRDCLWTLSGVVKDARSVPGFLLLLPRLFKAVAFALTVPIHEAMLVRRPPAREP